MDRGRLRAARVYRASARGRAVRVLGLLALGGLSLVSAPAANASTNFTWTGAAGPAAPTWSENDNWASDTAPAPDTSIGTLSFPALPESLPCVFKTPNDGCGRGSENDVSGLSIEALSIDDCEDYSIVGEKPVGETPITLGSGGLAASPTATTSKLTLSELDLPIALGAAQTWSIEGAGGIEHLLENDLYLGGELTGSGSALTVDMGDGPLLLLEDEAEVGPVSIAGTDPAEAGIFNGAVEFVGDLNSTDRNPVSLSHIFFSGVGAMGQLTTDAAELAVGANAPPAEGIAATSVKLDSASSVGFEILEAGASAQKDYSRLTSPGAIELGSASIEVVVRPPETGKSCPTLTPGQTYTFVSTTATLSGAFSNAPEHGPEIPIRFAKACKVSTSQTMRIAYRESGDPKTVTGTVEAEAREKQEATERQEAKERQEAQERQEAKERQAASERQLAQEAENRKIAEAAAVKKSEEEAAAKKRQGEEASAAATKKRQEEETAAAQETAAVTGSVTLAGSTIAVQSSGAAAVKLACTGTGTCSGRLTLAGKKDKKAKTIGSASFSIPAGKTATVKLTLNAVGRALLGAAHELSATLTISKSSPAPSQTHTSDVRLVQVKAHGKARR